MRISDEVNLIHHTYINTHVYISIHMQILLIIHSTIIIIIKSIHTIVRIKEASGAFWSFRINEMLKKSNDNKKNK